MQEPLVFDEQELERIGIVCPGCNAEAIFDLTKDYTANQAHACPGCDQPLLESLVVHERWHFNWLTWYKRARDAKDKKVRIKFYFKRPE